jgi:hypothetical protein
MTIMPRTYPEESRHDAIEIPEGMKTQLSRSLRISESLMP